MNLKEKLWIVCAAFLMVYAFLDVRILLRNFERLSHVIQRHTGRNCFFLANVCVLGWAIFILRSVIVNQSLQRLGNASLVAITLVIVTSVALNFRFFIADRYRPNIGFRNVRIYTEWPCRLITLGLFAFCLLISIRGDGFNSDDIALSFLVAAVYFRACTPLPPSMAKVRKRVPLFARLRPVKVSA